MTDDRLTRSHQPTDRLTRLCAEMVLPLERSENLDVQAIVFLHDEDRGGIVTHGYDSNRADDFEAMVDLLVHLKAMFRAQGKDLVLVPMTHPEN